ncbi:MAG: glyceraldehyde 3-phosphate dehydrogenase NAD-binding domain-containing protein [Candidatus Paceibacterota bacterium]|jgi:glyceraldehyde 3-phosphate dehydrogenase
MPKKKVAINGFGRIGRLFFRQAFGRPEFDIIAINDLGSVANLAYLLKHDSVYGKYHHDIIVDEANRTFTIAGKTIQFLNEKDPAMLPWGKLGIDLAIESTGFFESFEKAEGHINAGAKRAIITAPAKDAEGTSGGATVLMGVNDGKLKTCAISSNASCTTNSASPVMQILQEGLGIKKAILSTVHGITNTQSTNDAPVRDGTDYRRGRAAGHNIVPSTTGAAIAVTRAIPALEKKFDGLAFRVPVITGSLADITFISSRQTTVDEVNNIFKKAEADPRWHGIMKTTTEQLVSSDIIGEPYGAIVDLNFTKVVDGDLVKVLSWYDNEWGYVATLLMHSVKALA